MPRKVPQYLRLHQEPSQGTDQPATWPELDSLNQAFLRATGWQLVGRPLDVAEEPNEIWSMPVQVDADQIRLALVEPGTANSERLEFDAVRLLGKTIGELLSELGQTRDALWQREAELAAGVPVISHHEEEAHLAARLEAVLKCGAEAVQCDAAALYLLDDATSQLKLRACFGLPKQRLTENARPLRGAAADLEALVGHAVAVSDLSKFANWKLPEGFISALCVPVSTPTTPLGTLWLFSSQPREYTQHQTDVAEIVAGRLSADLEREVLLAQGLEFTKMRRQQDAAAQWQQDRRPTFAPLLDEFQIAGWAHLPGTIARGFHDWNVLPAGRVTAAVGQGRGELFDAALTAASIHASLRSHCAYPHTAGELVTRMNETLWQSSVGGQFASLGYALIDPASFKVQWSAAGSAGAILSAKKESILLEGGPELGAEPEHRFREREFGMQPGETLVLLSDSPWQARNEAGQKLREQWPAFSGSSAEQIARQYGEWLLSHSELRNEECHLVVVRRRKGS